MSAVIQIRDLACGFPNLTLFRHLSFDIDAGTTLAVLGANGSGKSTFVKMLLGLIPPLSGQITWPKGRPHEVGYLAQMTEFDRRFPIRVRDLVAMGAWRGFGLRSGLDRVGRDKVAAALDEVGLLAIADRPLYALSRGQLQRALFARVIVQDTPLILLDEPFAAVDESTEDHLLSIIERWRQEDRVVVMVVHNLSSVLDHCTQVLLLGGGEATYGEVESVLVPERLLAHGYLSESQAAWLFRDHAKQSVSNGA